MGSACGITKKPHVPAHHTSSPLPTPRFVPGFEPPCARSAKIGPFLVPLVPSQTLLKKLARWNHLLAEVPFADASVQSPHYRRLLSEVLAGPPSQYRWQAWLTILGVKQKVSADAYRRLPSQNSSADQEIKKDLDRTFPDHPYFDLEKHGHIGQAALRRVLCKYACAHPEVGYCQGMNYVVGFLLLASGGSEVEAYYVLEGLGVNQAFAEDMWTVKKQLWAFKQLLRQRLPHLAKHFKAEDFAEEAWLLKWLMSLFTLNFRLPVALRLWDHFVVDKDLFIFKFALALLSKYQKQLKKMDLTQLYTFFGAVDQLDIEQVLADARRVTLTKSQLETLQSSFGRGSNLEVTPVKNTPTLQHVVFSQTFKESLPQLKTPRTGRNLGGPTNRCSLPSIYQLKRFSTHFNGVSSDEDSPSINVKSILDALLRGEEPTPGLPSSLFSELSTASNRN